MKTKKFWNWKNQTETNERTLFLNGTIAEESWFDDDVTPQLFKDELNAGKGDITVWINSPGGDCVAAAQIYNMLTNYNGKVLTEIIEAWNNGNLEKARELQNFAQEVINIICHYRGNIVGGKRIMKLIGLDLGANRTPFQNMTNEEESAMKSELEAINFFDRCNK